VIRGCCRLDRLIGSEKLALVCVGRDDVDRPVATLLIGRWRLERKAVVFLMF
jgi:hypothetical protein